MQDIHLAFVEARNGLKTLNSGKFAFEGPVGLKPVSIDDLDRAVSADHVAREPDLTVAAGADSPEELVVRYVGRQMRLGPRRQTSRQSHPAFNRPCRALRHRFRRCNFRTSFFTRRVTRYLAM
jgi:hypothetical protein